MKADNNGRTRRYCANCGAKASLANAFCGSCGAPFASEADSSVPTRRMAGPLRERVGIYPLPSTRLPDLGRNALLGLLLALACAGLLVAALYALLALRGAFSDSSTPSTLGLALFALLHGSSATVEVPPIPALLGLGGSLQLGLPVTSFVLLPFIVSLLLGRLLARRAQTATVFVLGAALAYALVVALLTAFGAVSGDAGGATVRFVPDPLSAALRGFLWVGLGTMLGTAAAHGPFLSTRPRQVLRGALWAVGTSVVLTVLLAIVAGILQQGLGASAPQATGAPSQVISSESALGDGLAGVGALFALLPAWLGTLWLLAHGVPVGFQNAPDLSGLPLIGEALADIPLRVSLAAEWPWGVAWRLLLMAPVVGLVLGGRVAARGAPRADRWWQGALAGAVYAAITFLVALLVGLKAGVTLAGAASLQASFGASLAWLLLVLPAGAALGAAGSLLTGDETAPVPRPRRTFVVTSVAGVLILAASLPVALAASSPGSIVPTSSAPFGELIAEQSPADTPSEATSQEDASPTTKQTSKDTIPEAPVTQNASPAPAFDTILPTLRQTTTAPIMLPAELPGELENVAVDADRGGGEYGILFLSRPTDNVLESYVRANVVGTLTASPEPRDTAKEYVGVTSTETVELPDGTEATLRYMDPSLEGYNQGPFWEAEFENLGHTYTLGIFLDDPSGEIAKRILSSIVLMPGSGADDTGSDYTASDDLQAGAEEAAGDYYRAAGIEDWTYTYENLDSETQSLFAKDEWFLKNQWFRSKEPVIYNILSVEPQDTSGDPIAEASVQITGEDGSSSIRTTYFVLENGTWKHRFGEEETGLFMPGVPFDEFVLAQGG